MYPQGTEYRLACTSAQYKMCQSLARSNGMDVKLSFPTVMALRDGKLIGFLSTRASKKAVMAGPLVMNGLLSKGIVAMRLAEAYEQILSEAGVTDYLFSIDKGNKWAKIVQRAMEITPYGESDKAYWFKRTIP